MKALLRFFFPLLIGAIAGCSSRSMARTHQPVRGEKDTVQQPNDAKLRASYPEHSLKNRFGGTFSFGKDVEKGPVGTLKVYPLTDSSALFFLDVCRGAPSYNLGQLDGEMQLKGTMGSYRVTEDAYFDCGLTFRFSGNSVKVSTDTLHDVCGFGGFVYADNVYKRTDPTIPDYFIDGEGDTVFFRSLVKKPRGN